MELHPLMKSIFKDSKSPWPFFVLTLGFSWLFWIIAGLLPQPLSALPVWIFYLLGGLMPLTTALFLLYTFGDRAAQRDYWIRTVDLERIGPGWLTAALLIPAALTALSVLLDRVLGGTGASPEAVSLLFASPLAFLQLALLLFLVGPLPEELAWRGYSLDQLQGRWNALASSLILGVLWTIWHLPLFFIEGTYQHGLGIGTQAFWLYMLDKVPQSILMTWIYNNTRRSTLTAILFHFMVNFTGELYELTLRADQIYIGLQILAAFAVTTTFGPQRLMRHPRKM
jgi:membrane protease YdiL (CAAX protease family)